MAKVAAAGPVHPSNALKFGGSGGSKVTSTTVKRKTPSELRGEQLKRKNTTQLLDESSAPICGSMSNGVFPGPKRSDVSKNPRYIDTRVDELFPVRKNSIRLNLISRKDNVKESFPEEQSGSTKKFSVPSAFPAENQQQLKCPESFLASTVSGKDCATKTCSTSQRCNENTFRSVTELSLGGVDAHGLSTIDMDKALRGLATHEHQVASAKIAESSEPDGGSRSKIFSSELYVPCKMTPLDLTMKTNIRVVSASSINWFHRLINCGTSNVVAWFTSSNCSTSQKMTCFPEMNSVSQAVKHWSLHSWMYPQSPLPPSVISALTLSASTGGQLDFLSERQLAWQDSFRSLYYMLRKNVCSIFYVCTAQFVVMFTSSYSEENCVCNAYISQSTRGLRSSLKEHDVSFSMPLCPSYSVLINLVNQLAADGFYCSFNGKRFRPTEAEVCHVYFIQSVEYAESAHIACTPPVGYTELPTCPVCLERLDQDTSGIQSTLCDHSFQCSCVSKWTYLACQVCRLCQQQDERPACSECGTLKNLCVCLICGFVGCGRYEKRHAIKHWSDVAHHYSLELETQQIWDYVGDKYVHRLNHSKGDGKLVTVNSSCTAADGECTTCGYDVDSSFSGALFTSKVDSIVDEYNNLLASQLEAQRQHYESLLAEAKSGKESSISRAVEKAVFSKMNDMQAKIEMYTEETKSVAERNEVLLRNQQLLQTKCKETEEREKLSLKLKDEKILDLKEQIRDLKVYVEAQRKLSNMGISDGKGGSVLSVESNQSSSNSRRRSKLGRRRN